VGISILRNALTENGYRVHYLGTHNQLKEFFQFAYLCNVVMISNMDGHAWHYLREFPDLRRQYLIASEGALWYLGGNLTTGDSVGHERHYREMGFDRVFVRFVDVRTVLELLERDLYDVKAMAQNAELLGKVQSMHRSFLATPSEETLPISDLERMRTEVLQHWKTGREGQSLEENAEFLVRQPSFPKIQAEVNCGKRQILVQPRSGVALVDEQIKLFKAFKSVGVPVLSYQVDSLTRNNDYVGAGEAIHESRISSYSVLNGFPVINHGVSGLRRIISEVRIPLQTRHSARDPRLLAEVSYAGGVTAFEGGAICYNIPYYKNYSLNESIHMWQYVDRLTGLYYEKFGIVLDREFFGVLTGTLMPPSLAIITSILESILAIQQGVKCVSLGYTEQGHRIQDVAAIRTMASIAREIIQNMGYKNVQINTVFHQYMAAFPTVPERAEELIYNSAVTAGMAGATRMLCKTPVEYYKIPSMLDNLEGISLVMAGIKKAQNKKVDEIRVAEESAIIRHEVESILDSILFCGNGNIIQGIITGFRKGYIDIPFSPSIFNAGQAMTARDAEGAIRFVSFGNLQFGNELRQFHRDKMAERRRFESAAVEKNNCLLVEKDVLQIARGQYEHWPLFE